MNENNLVFTIKRSVPIILQVEMAECGLASIAMVAGYYGHELDMPAMRKGFSVILKEPVYRLTATLDTQQISAYGKAFSLKSGMLFEADIMLEQRTLIECLFEPLFSLQGRVS